MKETTIDTQILSLLLSHSQFSFPFFHLENLCISSHLIEEKNRAMADVLLSSLLRTILTNLTSSALQEFGIAWGLKTELQNLKSTLGTIQAVLVDAEAKQWTNEAVKDWLRKLKDSAYDADNVLDEFATEALKRKLDSQRGAVHRTLVRYQLPMVVIVFNNSGVYGGDRRSLEEIIGLFKDEPAPTSFNPGAAYLLLIDTFQGKGYLVGTPDELKSFAGPEARCDKRHGRSICWC